MNALTISNAAQAAPTARPTGAVTTAEDGAGTCAGEAGFAGLLDAGIGRSARAAQIPESTEIAKLAKTDADKDATASDPAALLDAIAAGQANPDPQHHPGAAPAAAPPAPPSLVAFDPRDTQAASNNGIALSVIARESLLPARSGAGSAKIVRQSSTQNPVESQRAPEGRRGADAVAIANAAPSAGPASAGFPAVRAEMPEHRQEVSAGPLPTPSSPAAFAHAGPAMHPTTAATMAANVEHLAQPFGNPAWDDGFSSRIVWMAKNNVQSAAIRLNPPDLGPIEVKLTLTSDPGAQSSASVQFSATHAVTRDAIESALPRLREMLQENGIALGNTSVDAGTADNANGSADHSGQSAGSAVRGHDAGQTLESAAQPQLAQPLRRGKGLVDTFA